MGACDPNMMLSPSAIPSHPYSMVLPALLAQVAAKVRGVVPCRRPSPRAVSPCHERPRFNIPAVSRHKVAFAVRLRRRQYGPSYVLPHAVYQFIESVIVASANGHIFRVLVKFPFLDQISHASHDSYDARRCIDHRLRAN